MQLVALAAKSAKAYTVHKMEENEMKKIINRIVFSDDKEKIERYADYRNYMNYEILVSNDVLNKAKLSKQSGFNQAQRYRYHIF